MKLFKNRNKELSFPIPDEVNYYSDMLLIYRTQHRALNDILMKHDGVTGGRIAIHVVELQRMIENYEMLLSKAARKTK